MSASHSSSCNPAQGVVYPGEHPGRRILRRGRLGYTRKPCFTRETKRETDQIAGSYGNRCPRAVAQEGGTVSSALRGPHSGPVFFFFGRISLPFTCCKVSRLLQARKKSQNDPRTSLSSRRILDQSQETPPFPCDYEICLVPFGRPVARGTSWGQRGLGLALLTHAYPFSRSFGRQMPRAYKTNGGRVAYIHCLS